MASSTYAPSHRHEFRSSAADPSPRSVPAITTQRAGGGGAALCFTATLFISAALLFLVQPMIGKMILPLLGGTPAVWNACMLFFQAALLGGYAYAHLTTSWLGVRRQAVMHLAVLLVPLMVLPIVVGRGTPPPADANPVLWLLLCLAVTVGLPFFVVSTTGPLLQRWFADTGHPSASDPFFLYAASNVGSLLALLGYPLVMERALVLADQSHVWAYGYGLLVILIGLCAVLMWRSNPNTRAVSERMAGSDGFGDPSSGRTVAAPTVGRRMWWVFAAFVPSSLMLGVTAHVTSNLAPVPLLWVLPLAIYLLTFVFVFARSRPIPHSWMVRALPFLLPPLAVMTFLELPSMAWIAVVVHLVGFFVAAMVCHGELANSRPTARHLTEFYLWMSTGGVLGGVFNALVAPLVFDTIAEYPLAIMLTCMFLPTLVAGKSTVRDRRRDWLFPLGLGVVSALILAVIRTANWGESLGLRFIVFGLLAVFCFSFKDRPVRFTLGMGVFLLTVSAYCAFHRGSELHASRNFFGVKRVVVDSTGAFRVLIHGNTTHGKQFIDPKRSTEPLTYYHRTGPLGDIFAAFSGEAAKVRVGAVGLGTGSIASYINPGQTVRIYEIDPDVERIARDPRYFSYLAQCAGDWDVVLGDGRNSLVDEPDGHFGLIVLDAFSSDSIPTHLLTREAIQLYLTKLEDDGLLAFHISNRYLHLEPLLASLAEDAGLHGLIRADMKTSKEDNADGKTAAIYVAMARRERDLGPLAGNEEWKTLDAVADTPVWTDQYTSLLSFVHWR